MDVVTMSLRIVGGTSLPRNVGTLSATWPLAVLTTSDSGLSVDLRPTLLKRTLAKRPIEESPCWSVEWPELAKVDFGRRSVVLRPRQGKGCRFVTLTRQRMLPLIKELEQRGITVTQKTTTIGWFAKG